MTIARGRPWGSPGALPEDGVVVTSDAEARHVVEAARRAGRGIPPLGLLAGDLCRTVGGPGDRARLSTDAAVTFPVDLGAVLLDGQSHWFVAHLVARSRWWRRSFVAMNAQTLGTWVLGPRAHPNDGLLDTADADLRPADLLRIRARLPTGAHLPHPRIRARRAPTVQVWFPSPLAVWLDGERVGTARTLSVRIEPDAFTVVV